MAGDHDPDALGAPVIGYSYDTAGNPLGVTDPLGNVTTYDYDNLRRLVTVTGDDPDAQQGGNGPVTEYGYDAAGRMVSMLDPLGRLTGYEYDALHRLVARTTPAAGGVAGAGGTPVGLRPPSVPPAPWFSNRDSLVTSMLLSLLAHYSNKRGGKCLTYIGTEARGQRAKSRVALQPGHHKLPE